MEYRQVTSQNYPVQDNVIQVIVDNMVSDNKRVNYENFIRGLNFYHTMNGFRPYPPGVYFSEDIRFLKSTITHYEEKIVDIYQKLDKMDLDQYLSYLEKIYESVDREGNYTKKESMEEYLSQFVRKYKIRKGYKLFCVASGNNFICKSMYLFDILPVFFLKMKV